MRTEERILTARGLEEKVTRKTCGKQRAQRQSRAGRGREWDLGPEAVGGGVDQEARGPGAKWAAGQRKEGLRTE